VLLPRISPSNPADCQLDAGFWEILKVKKNSHRPTSFGAGITASAACSTAFSNSPVTRQILFRVRREPSAPGAEAPLAEIECVFSGAPVLKPSASSEGCCLYPPNAERCVWIKSAFCITLFKSRLGSLPLPFRQRRNSGLPSVQLL
jgi:hypothetical protein